MNELIAFLYTALRSECGIKLSTSDPERLRQKLYKIRKDDPELEVLSFVISPTNPQGELWLVKRIADEG